MAMKEEGDGEGKELDEKGKMGRGKTEKGEKRGREKGGTGGKKMLAEGKEGSEGRRGVRKG